MVSLTKVITGGHQGKHPVDDIPPLAKLAPLGLQHVLAMYAGAVAVPLIVGGALVAQGKLQSSDLPYLITADLFVAGIATLIQAIGFWRFGVRLPLMQGCTFAAVAPMITIGSQYGITAIYGSVIASGIFMMLLAPVFGRLLHLFPPLVTGTVILIIGLSLMPVAANWFGGGTPGVTEDFGSPANIGLGAFTLIVIIALERFGPEAIKRLSILIGLVIGTVVAVPFGMTDFSGVSEQNWVGITMPFHFGLPSFQITAIISMLIVALVIMTETTGDILAVGEIVDKKVEPRQLSDGLRADGLSTVLGGVFNTFPYTAFAQNVGLVAITGVKTRHVASFAGIILILLGILPKLGAVVEGVPLSVLGGAGIALFGMVAASGVRTLSQVRFNNTNVLVVAISVGVGLLPTVSPTLYEDFPTWFQTIFDSGISAGALTAILLNMLLNSETLQRKFAQDSDTPPHDAVRGPAL
ncbi:xanthine permease [Rhodococcoides trifolii]|uniref:Xanthine permease n=1 Tax=Rhodococcoides trifolii TaxID=908250 RepID=A0A917LFW9_9NOCA|nr:nucleobase:cation symporter-2 family protein [Rhodococcus trifolii]GGG18947.1 xanthine permease [Rhodococcus trifolii]